jgi:hypothetical protein
LEANEQIEKDEKEKATAATEAAKKLPTTPEASTIKNYSRK